MVVVTAAARDDGELSGCLVGFTTQCSIHPVRSCVWLSTVNHTFGVAARTDTLVVHVLRAGDHEVARVFGEETGDCIDKFARVAWTAGPDGAPVLDGVDWFGGRVIDRIDDGGDHVAHVLEVMDIGRADRAHEPQLGYQQTKDLAAGHPA
jgi:flavin reductase (DIM6/NTAB) family NADH-FMN oxidoreductase RutF